MPFASVIAILITAWRDMRRNALSMAGYVGGCVRVLLSSLRIASTRARMPPAAAMHGIMSYCSARCHNSPSLLLVLQAATSVLAARSLTRSVPSRASVAKTFKPPAFAIAYAPRPVSAMWCNTTLAASVVSSFPARAVYTSMCTPPASMISS